MAKGGSPRCGSPKRHLRRRSRHLRKALLAASQEVIRILPRQISNSETGVWYVATAGRPLGWPGSLRHANQLLMIQKSRLVRCLALAVLLMSARWPPKRFPAPGIPEKLNAWTPAQAGIPLVIVSATLIPTRGHPL